MTYSVMAYVMCLGLRGLGIRVYGLPHSTHGITESVQQECSLSPNAYTCLMTMERLE